MLEDKILSTIKEYELIENGDTVVVGVSGGPDSMALLNVLINLKQKLKFEIVVAHVNHSLRKEADEETKFVEEFCKTKDIPIYIRKENVKELAEKQKIGTEEAGRKLRYDFFYEIANKIIKKKNNEKNSPNSKIELNEKYSKYQIKIATAHNANDNAETVLMNIIRGSGTSGLKGIDIKRDNFIRPLIKCTRNEIEEYCKEKHLEPKQDKTNKKNIYTRNKVRNILIPLIEKEFNPSIIVSLNRMSNIAKDENEYIQKQVEEIYKDIVIKENLEIQEKNEDTIDKKEKSIELNLKKFNKQELVIKNRLVIYTINKLVGTSKNIEKIHIADIIKLCENNIGNKYLTPNKNIKVMVNKGVITITTMQG